MMMMWLPPSNGPRLSCGASAGGRKRPALRYELAGAQTCASPKGRPRQLQAHVRRRPSPTVFPIGISIEQGSVPAVVEFTDLVYLARKSWERSGLTAGSGGSEAV